MPERYETAKLNNKQFLATFNRIRKENRKNRRSAKRTLPANILDADVNAIGLDAEGNTFSKEDLEHFKFKKESIRKTLDVKTAGIPYHQLISRSRDIDVKRANNASNDGYGIAKTIPIAMRGDVVMFRVQASARSVHEEHLVSIQLNQWQDIMEHVARGSLASAQAAVKKACNGKMSVNCDCGRFQYHYRYIATQGNYVLAPPVEHSYPKVKNPHLEGSACKHIIKSATKLQSPTVQKFLVSRLLEQMGSVGYADDTGRARKMFNDEEMAELKRARSDMTDQARADQAFKKYQKAQAQFKKLLLNQQNKAARDELRAAKSKAARLKKKNEAQKRKISALKKQVRDSQNDALKVKLSGWIDAMKVAGIKKDQALALFAKENNLTAARVKKLL